MSKVKDLLNEFTYEESWEPIQFYLSLILFAFLKMQYTIENNEYDEIDAFDQLLVISDVFQKLQPELSKVIGALSEIANPSPPLKDKLESFNRQIVKIDADVNNMKEKISPLIALRENLDEKIEEKTKLEADLKLLEMAKNLTPHTETIKRQIDLLQKQVTKEKVEEIQWLQDDLKDIFGDALLFSKEIIEEMHAEINQLHDELKEGIQELGNVQGDLINAYERYKDIEKELAEKREVLAIYFDADKAIEKAITNGKNVTLNNALQHIERALIGFDTALNKARLANEKAKSLSKLGYN